MTSPLAIRVQHQPLETATSFASRLAAANGRDYVNDFCLDLGMEFQKIVDGRPEEIRQLAFWGNVDAQNLQECAVRKLPDRQILVATHLMGRRSARQTRLRFCPDCVLEQIAVSDWKNVYCTADIHFESYRTCVKHDRPLACLPLGVFPRSPHDYCGLIRDHFPDVQTAGNDPIRRSATPFEMYVFQRLRGLQEATWLNDLDLHVVTKTCELLGLVMLYGEGLNQRKISEEMWLRAGACGFDNIRANKASLSAVLMKLKNETKIRTQGSLRYMGHFYHWLDFKNRHQQFEPIKEIVREFVFENHAIAEGETIFGKPCKQRRLHSITSACVETGLHRATIMRIFENEGHLDRAQMLHNTHQLLFPAKELQPLLDSLNTAMPQTKAQIYLNMSRPQFNSLKSQGFLKPVKVFRGARATYKKADLDAFWAQISQNTIEVDAPSKGMCGVSLTANKIVCPTTEIISHLVSGKLENIERIRNQTGLAALFIDVDELRTLLPAKNSNWIFRNELCDILGVNDWGLKALIEGGYLTIERVRNLDTRKIADAASIKEVEAFIEKYVSLRNLAQELSISDRVLVYQLKKLKIDRIPFPENVRSIVYMRQVLPLHSDLSD